MYVLNGPRHVLRVPKLSSKLSHYPALLPSTVTPMQSMFSHLVHEHFTGERNLKKLKFVWIQRDPELLVESDDPSMLDWDEDSDVIFESMMSSFKSSLRSSLPASDTDRLMSSFRSSLRSSLPAGEIDRLMSGSFSRRSLRSSLPAGETDRLKGSLRSSLPAGDEADPELGKINEEEDGSIDASSDLEGENYELTDSIPEGDHSPNNIKGNAMSQTEEVFEMEPARLHDVLDMEMYLTKENEVNSRHSQHIPGVQLGRPGIAELFSKIAEEAIKLDEKRVAVCVCGPKVVTSQCRKACIELSDNTVRFDYHEEVFG